MISSLKTSIEFIFSVALLINALLFIPQIIKIFREKTAKSLSLLTFLGFFLIQLVIVLHGFINHDYLLTSGYLLSMLTCGLVVALILFYKYKRRDGIVSGGEVSFEDILEQLPGHIYWKDREGFCLGCNSNNWKDFGLKSLSSIKGKTDYDLFSKAEADQIRVVDEEVIRTGKLRVVEETLTVAGKTSLYLSYKVPLKDKDHQIIGILGTSVDITQSKQEVIEQLNMLENIIAVMPGNVYWMNREGIYLGCNDNEANAVGLRSRQEIVGKRNVDIPGFVIPEFLDEVNKQVMEEGGSVVIEEPARLQDGTEATFLSSKVPLQNRAGEVVGMVGISIDITERKAAEKSLKSAKEMAEVANKAKTEFLCNMQHDFRTPFSGILGLAQLLESQETEPEKKESLSYITQSAQALLDQLNEIFEFLEAESGHLPILEKEFDLHSILNDVFSMMLPSSRNKQLDFSLTIDPNLPKYVVGDRVRAQRILMNLIANAIKFTKKGYVKIDAKVAGTRDKHIIVSFVIQDTGIGIPADKQGIIFERFNRLTSSYSGVYSGKGLGLRVVKQLLDEIDGRCYLDSEVDKGTTFKILIPYKLPLMEPENSEVEDEGSDLKVTNLAISHKKMDNMEKKMNTENSAETSIIPKAKSAILLIEDHPIAAKVVKNVLLSLDCEVDVAMDGKMAMELIEKRYYDLIFMDIGLPDIDGYEISRHVRSHSIRSIAQIPIVALTAHDDTDNKQQCLDASINSVVTKPLTLQEAQNILDLFIPRRKKYAKQPVQPEHETSGQEQEEKIVDFDYAKKLLGGNEAAVLEMLRMLVESLPHEAEKLEEAYQQQNWEMIQGVSHKLQGAASYCGTIRLKSICSELDSYIKLGLVARMPELYQQLLAEMSAVEKFMEKWRV